MFALFQPETRLVLSLAEVSQETIAEDGCYSLSVVTMLSVRTPWCCGCTWLLESGTYPRRAKRKREQPGTANSIKRGWLRQPVSRDTSICIWYGPWKHRNIIQYPNIQRCRVSWWRSRGQNSDGCRKCWWLCQELKAWD